MESKILPPHGRRPRSLRSVFKASVSPLIICIATAVPAGAALAQASAAPSGEVESVVVTGSRVVRDGFQSPTPMTVNSAEQIAATGVKDVSEFVQTIPSVASGMTLAASSRQTGTGLVGLVTPGLRGLGSLRTLVLLDGQRSVGSDVQGNVDTSTFPQDLISRIEVVTGGASAAYGSDAVSGVINYVLDKNYTGLKMSSSVGVTRYDDDRNASLSVAYGTPFADGRGHLLLNGSAYWTEGVVGDPKNFTPNPRKWLYNSAGQLVNPAYTATNGQPYFTLFDNIGDPGAIKNGSIIYNGPLRNTAFTLQGTPFRVTPGYIPSTGGNMMSGGDYLLSEVSGATTLDPRQRRQSFFSRVSFDVTDNVNIYGQYSWNHSNTYSAFCCVRMQVNVPFYTPGFGANPFLPSATYAQALTAYNVAANPNATYSLPVGAYPTDLHNAGLNDRVVQRAVAGLDAKFDAFGTPWTMNAYAQRGVYDGHNQYMQNYIQGRMAFALQAVTNAQGQVVCAGVAQNNPAAAGCQPYNIFGTPTQAARDYVGFNDEGSYINLNYTQDVAAVAFNGEPITLWAGPVSTAFGFEARKLKLESSVDPYSMAALVGRNPALGRVGQFSTVDGKITVREGFFETVIPLLNEQPMAYALEFNGAVRRTHYSQSGGVTTWKAGLTYKPIEQLTFRGTRSRDIRAPNISELYSLGNNTVIFGVYRDGATQLGTVNISSVGNPNLQPEKADSIGYGVVWQPSFLPGLSGSVDYYKIKVNGAIATPNAPQGYFNGLPQYIIDQCNAGNTTYCASVVRNSGVITAVLTSPINYQKLVNSGIDFEVAYRKNLEDILPALRGNLTLRWTATNYLKALAVDGIVESVNTIGAGSQRSWRQNYTVNYNLDPISVNLTARVANAGVVNISYIGCDSNCPTYIPSTTLTSTSRNPTISKAGNRLPGFVYFDLSTSYKFAINGANSTLSLNVRNLFDKDPFRTANSGGAGVRGTRGTLDGFYDMMGRAYQLTLRVAL